MKVVILDHTARAVGTWSEVAADLGVCPTPRPNFPLLVGAKFVGTLRQGAERVIREAETQYDGVSCFHFSVAAGVYPSCDGCGAGIYTLPQDRRALREDIAQSLRDGFAYKAKQEL